MIRQTSRTFEVRYSTELVEPLLSLYWLENSTPTANPGRRSTVWSSRKQFLCKVTIFPTFAQRWENSSSWHHGEQTCNSPLNRYPHTSVLNSTTEGKRAVKQLLRYLKGARNTCLRLEPHVPVQRGMIEFVGRSDSDKTKKLLNAPKCHRLSLQCIRSHVV